MADKETLKQLVNEAAEVATMFAMATGRLELKGDNVEPKDIETKFQMKWIDACAKAVENIDPAIGEPAFEDICNDFAVLISVPLNGIIRSFQEYANSKNITLPPLDKVPTEIFEFKRFAMNYITECRKLIG